MSLEVLVLVNKFGEGTNDYDRILEHQTEVHKLMINKLSEKQSA